MTAPTGGDEGRARPIRLLCVTVDREVAEDVVRLAGELPGRVPGLGGPAELSWLPDAGDLALAVLIRKPDVVLLDLAAEGVYEALVASGHRWQRGVPGVRPAWFCLTRARTSLAVPPACRSFVGQIWKPLDAAAPEVVARGVAEARAREADVVIDRYHTTLEARPEPAATTPEAMPAANPSP
jgi:hypothetical protein